jgi:opacity protein-like surface antigen
MFSSKLSISLLVTALVSTIAIGSATAGESSSLKMSSSDLKVSVSPEQRTSKPQLKKNAARNVQRDDRQTGWYWGTVRGANFPNMNISNSQGNANWGGNNSLGGLIDLSNINAFAGYKSSNFRLEGELFYTNNSMTLANGNTIPKNTVTDLTQKPNGVPGDCNATTFGAIVNGYYDIETGGQIKPFVGAGIGYTATNLKGEGRDWGSASGLTYQLKAGVGYAISDQQDIYVQYKYINAPANYAIGTTSASTDFSYGSVEFGTKFNF